VDFCWYIRLRWPPILLFFLFGSFHPNQSFKYAKLLLASGNEYDFRIAGTPSFFIYYFLGKILNLAEFLAIKKGAPACFLIIFRATKGLCWIQVPWQSVEEKSEPKSS